LQGKVFEDVNAALGAARELASANDLILVCGSVFLVAEVEY
jgi:dihydrofolate synthase/folylpolyglutamate synthase